MTRKIYQNKNILYPVVFITFVISGILSFYLQFNINKFTKEISGIQKEISKTDMEIKILKAEISHLTSIIKIKEIANKYLRNYKNISNNDFIKVVDIPINPRFK